MSAPHSIPPFQGPDYGKIVLDLISPKRPSQTHGKQPHVPKTIGPWTYQPPPPERPAVETTALIHLKERIKDVAEGPDPVRALRHVASLWEALDGAVQLAQARSRLLLGRIQRPKVAETPSWLVGQLEMLGSTDDEGPAATEAAIESAGQLIRYVIAQDKTRTLRATLEKGPLGRVLIEWDSQHGRLQWLVAPPELPWPGASISVLARRGRGSQATRESRVLFNVFDAYNHLLKFYDV
jgi:hypothetical protein